MKFEWDPKKNKSNQEKHGIMFESAKRVFNDPNKITTESPRGKELRYKTIGLLGKFATVVVWCFRSGGEVIRIISARLPNKKEENLYNENKK